MSNLQIFSMQYYLMTVAGTANCKMNFNMLTDKESGNMCRVFEETWAEGKAEGKA